MSPEAKIVIIAVGLLAALVLAYVYDLSQGTSIALLIGLCVTAVLLDRVKS